MTDISLSDRTVMITGASRGLGRAIAEACAAAGARLALCARGPDDLRAAAESLERAGADVVWAPADVTDADAVHELVARAGERLGGVDALINNASVLGRRVPIREQSPDEWRSVMDINVTGALIPILAVLPGMRSRGGGSIINVTSGVGNRPRARWGPYAVSKWGVEALTYNLALEEEESGVRVNAVDPGSVRTAMRKAAYPDEDPMGPAPPEAVTGVFVWLASSASEGVTGQRFNAQEWRADG